MDHIQKITEKDLPSEWRNEIILEKSNPEDGVFFIRSSIANLKECNDWAHFFSKKTSTQWNNRSSKPNPTNKIICKKTFVCHRSAYNKRLSSKRAIQKNTFCLAKLDLVVRVTTRYTRRKDPYSKKGMPGVIRIKARHTHPIDSPSALKFLTPSRDLQETFYEYFEMGMGIVTSCRYHENKLLVNGVTDATDSKGILKNPYYNPSKRTVQYWCDLWRKASECQRNRVLLIKEEDDENIDGNVDEIVDENVDKNIGEDIVMTDVDTINEKEDTDSFFISELEANDSDSVNQSAPENTEISTLDVLQPNTTQNEMDCVDVIDLPPQSSSEFKNVITMMKKLHEKFGGSEQVNKAYGKLAARLREIKSADEWENFLHSAAEIPLHRTDDPKKVQPKVIQKPNTKIRQAVFMLM